MSKRLLVALAVVVGVVLLILTSALFTVHQTQQALVVQLGNPVREIKKAGLNYKIPFLQQVEFFEKRVLDFDADPVELILGDQKRLVVDAFTRYRIENPLRFRQSTGSEIAFRSRLEPIVFGVPGHIRC